MKSNPLSKNKRFWNLALALLLIVNVSALSSFIIAKLSSGPKTTAAGPDWAVETFLMENIGFDDSQMAEYRKLKEDYDRKSAAIRADMHETMNILLREVSAADAYTASIDRHSEQYGVYQAQLKKETMRHMTNIRKLCRADQRERFTEIFTQLQHRGRGEGHGRGRGMGQGMGGRRFRGGEHSQTERQPVQKDTASSGWETF